MSAAQFTPGPWDALPKASYVHVADKGHVAKITNPWNDRVEREANVHLIAAAPELYEALELFVLEYVELVDSGDAGFWDAEKEGKVIIARAALAKARGASAMSAFGQDPQGLEAQPASATRQGDAQ